VDKANDPKPSPGLQTSKVEVSRDLSAAARRNMEQMTLAALVG
jgi:hypothetical protein